MQKLAAAQVLIGRRERKPFHLLWIAQVHHRPERTALDIDLVSVR
jgi:hypothetical protein